ncbi:MAG: DUF1049 domain-containing protein [Solirubrobacterales bacterium]|nr:DUF1049 domain-containing protein [Solirubrobacterales bacterium]
MIDLPRRASTEQSPSPVEQPPPASGGPAEIDRPAVPDPAAAPEVSPSRPARTRASVAFIGAVGGAVILLLLLIFILENTESVKISYLGATGRLALGVALLLAAIAGALLVAIFGAARISQLRRLAKRQHR